MSGTTAALACGLLQPLTVPAAIEARAPPLWPLHVMLVLERIEHPERLTLGAPLKVIDRSETGWPPSRVRMQELSAATPAAAVAVTPTPIERMPMRPRKSVGTAAVARPV